MKGQIYFHIETSQLISTTKEINSFYMMATSTFDLLEPIVSEFLNFELLRSFVLLEI